MNLQPNFKEYTEMADDLARSGFTETQSESLARLISGVFTRIESYFERVRKEDKEYRERVRQEDWADRDRIRREDKEEHQRIRKELREEQLAFESRMETRFDTFEARVEAKIDTYHHQSIRWSVATLTTIMLTIVGAAVVYLVQTLTSGG